MNGAAAKHHSASYSLRLMEFDLTAGSGAKAREQSSSHTWAAVAIPRRTGIQPPECLPTRGISP